jgi:hypothetical protein
MKYILRLLVFLMMGSAYAQSNLPACAGHDVSKWSNCTATQILSNGHKYIGDFQRGRFNGQGAFYSPNGRVISEGLWVDDKLVSSVNTYAQGNLPRCLSSANRHNCFDSVTYVNGDKYVGEFKDGKANGLGTSYASNGSIINQGIWAGNVFVRSAPLQQAVAPTLQPSTAERDRLNAEIEAERNKRQELEQQLAAAKERESITAELDFERKKRQELEEQLKRAQQSISMPTQAASIGVVGRRIALVVGNANYKVRPLKNPRNDADDVSRSLRATGFEVIDLRDATLPQMRTAVRQFGDQLRNNDVGLVYYSGHGVEVKGRNYFIPVNADIQREDEIADQGLDVSLILEKMSTAGKGVNILIVDACRDDPFGRSFRSTSRGLANMDAPRGTIIAYATSPGKVASDGDPRERNSPYTKHLVKAMQSPNKPIEQVFKEVRRAVQDETKNQQTPWENTSLSGDFFFKVQK